jgi:colicin import membrane protein
MTEQAVEQTQPAEGAPGKATQEEPPPIENVQVSGNSDPKFYTEEDLAKAREQEKSKLYRRMDTMQSELESLKEQREAEAAQKAEEARQAEEAAKRKAEEDMSAKELIAAKEAEWAQQQAELRQQIEQERALRERETQFAELMDYRQQVIAQYEDRVAPELRDLITGETPEQIQQSAEDMAARTERIMEQTQQAMAQTRQQTPTARVTAPVSSGPDDEAVSRTYTPDDIRQMSMADYAKHRQRLLGQGATGGPKNRGIFG